MVLQERIAVAKLAKDEYGKYRAGHALPLLS
jgi:hypothetical protein